MPRSVVTSLQAGLGTIAHQTLSPKTLQSKLDRYLMLHR